MVRALITGGRAPVALDLARQLSTRGFDVIAADSAPCFLARSSRAIRRAYRVPPPRRAPAAFAEAIVGIAEREEIDLIVPTCEEVFYLARFAHRLPGHARLFAPDFDLLAQLHNKWRFAQLASGLGINVPETWLLQTVDDVARLHGLSGELVFKPAFSRFAVHTLIRPRPSSLQHLRPSLRQPWVAQRFIPGRELCSYSIARAGALKAHVTYEPIWRAGRSSSYYFRAIAHPTIEAFVASLVAKHGYSGQIAFDFIERDDRQTFVLECNPRATSGVHLFAPTHNLAPAFDGSAAQIIRPDPGTKGMLLPAMLLLGLWEAAKQHRIRQFAGDLRRGRDALWRGRDPLPAFYIYLGLGAFAFAALQQRVSLKTASTCDIEWDGEAIG